MYRYSLSTVYDQTTGVMLSGWQEIDENSYYFTTIEEAWQQSWFWESLKDTGLGKWTYKDLGYRSYGSMYVNEMTPDGQSVNEDGMKSFADEQGW